MIKYAILDSELGAFYHPIKCLVHMMSSIQTRTHSLWGIYHDGNSYEIVAH